jgi:hypothetical protein
LRFYGLKITQFTSFGDAKRFVSLQTFLRTPTEAISVPAIAFSKREGRLMPLAAEKRLKNAFLNKV